MSVGGPHVVGGAVGEVVVAAAEGADLVPFAGDVDDAGGGTGCFEERKEAQGEVEVADVVGAELGFDAIFGEFVGCGHDAGVVD